MTKKEAILKAATDLFALKGYKGTAVSEIAELADVAQGTVFHHFQSKENLLIAICDELVQTYVTGIRQAAQGPGSGWEALERVLLFNQEFRRRRQKAIAVAFRETGNLSRAAEEVHDHFCRLLKQILEVKCQCLEKGVADGSIQPVPADTTALLLHFLLVGKFHIEADGLLDIPELDSELLEFCRRSLVPVKSRDISSAVDSGG
jgi:AcrR family transcriptional regulator